MANTTYLGNGDLPTFFPVSSYVLDNLIYLAACSGFFRIVRKSIADLEKLHSVGQGEHLFLPTAVGHNQNKVLTMRAWWIFLTIF